MNKTTGILILLLIAACAPSGTQEDILGHSTPPAGEPITEDFYIYMAVKTGSLGLDSIGNYPLALQYIDSALSLNAKNPEALRIKSELYLLLDQPAEALETINLCILKTPPEAPGYLIRAGIYLVLNKRDSALADYYRAAGLDPSDGRIWEAIGYMEFDRGNKADGCGYLKKARDLGYLPGNSFSDSLLCL
ncbi:MAG: hypothetical protein JW801_03695 [Bacteroidales bacterium]|nr:hypothetical protein [Bacteroidales bacterium]